MLYNKKNCILMGISALLIIVGFVLMSGGQSENLRAFSPDICSSRRIVLAPIVCLSGFILMVYAILVHGGGDKSTEKEAKE